MNLFPLTIGQKVKTYNNARGVLIENRNYPWGPDHYVAIIETHPLYDIGDIEPFNRRDLKPIINLKTCVNRELS